MNYDISKPSAPTMPKLGKGKNASNYCSKRP